MAKRPTIRRFTAFYAVMQPTLIWFRRNLRCTDNRALMAAAATRRPMVGIFLLPAHGNNAAANARRHTFIQGCLNDLAQNLHRCGITLWTDSGCPTQKIPEIAGRFQAASVVCAEEYCPKTRLNDLQIAAALQKRQCTFESVNDSVLFAKNALTEANGNPFTDFSRYFPAWSDSINRPSEQLQTQTWTADCPLQPHFPTPIPHDSGSLNRMVSRSDPHTDRRGVAGGEHQAQRLAVSFFDRFSEYGWDGEHVRSLHSQLSPHLCYGTLSPRQLLQQALRQPDTPQRNMWLRQLAQRDFCHQYLYHFPDTVLPETASVADSSILQRWRNGMCGYPLIDAAMRCLNQTGLLHPLLRELCAAFWLHIGGSAQQGAAWFAEVLLDYDPAVNLINWRRLSAAAPSFRPLAASMKLDPDGRFIRRWLPEIAHLPVDLIHAPHQAQYSVNLNGYPAPLPLPRQTDR